MWMLTKLGGRMDELNEQFKKKEIEYIKGTHHNYSVK